VFDRVSTALSHRNPASPGKARDRRGVEGRDKRDPVSVHHGGISSVDCSRIHLRKTVPFAFTFKWSCQTYSA
jgi:hypothetical protein